MSNPEYEMHRQATAAAIMAARNMVSGEGVSPNTPISRIGDSEWQWIVAAAICAFIRTKSEQATALGRNIEESVRTTGERPEPWDAGAISAILPDLADTPGIDWPKPLTDWPREMIVAFLAAAFDLMNKAFAARDRGGRITRPATLREQREANAAMGGSLTAGDEMNDSIPFD